MRRPHTPTTCRSAGYSALELLFVVAILITGSAMAVLVSPQLAAFARASSSASELVSVLRTAREQAISQRRDMRLEFVAPRTVRVLREEIPGPGLTLLTEVQLEGTAEFLAFGGLPDTPDGFGSGAPVDFGGALSIQFTSEGTLVDQADDPLNGTIFLGSVGDPLSARAVTLFGPTAVIREWRWDGRQWLE